ncbi:hypothetical protein [Mycobacterium sp.]|uniref:biotin synthase auxiliary protein BsaP n=1 Tax=Mycobacterium sp. TaxID=1785 RepID=UPI003D6BC934
MVRDLPALLGAGVYNVYSGLRRDEPAGPSEPAAARLGLEPPRFCAECGRRLVVQVRPDGWWAKCSRHGRVDSADLQAQR